MVSYKEPSFSRLHLWNPKSPLETLSGTKLQSTPALCLYWAAKIAEMRQIKTLRIAPRWKISRMIQSCHTKRWGQNSQVRKGGKGGGNPNFLSGWFNNPEMTHDKSAGLGGSERELLGLFEPHLRTACRAMPENITWGSFWRGQQPYSWVPECDMGHSHNQHLPRKWRSSPKARLAHFIILMMHASCQVFPLSFIGKEGRW